MHISNFKTQCLEDIEILCEGLINNFYFSSCSEQWKNA